MSTDLKALLRRAQSMHVNSTPKKNDMGRPDPARTTHIREEQMAQIMTVQLEKLEEITSEINLLRSGFGHHIDTKVYKVQADLNVLQARRGNDASFPQTELGVQPQASEDKEISDEGGESSDSDESEDESRSERINDTAAYIHTYIYRPCTPIETPDRLTMDKSLRKINRFRKRRNGTRYRHENTKLCPILNERMEIPTDFPRTLSALRHKTPGRNYYLSSQIFGRF